MYEYDLNVDEMDNTKILDFAAAVLNKLLWITRKFKANFIFKFPLPKNALKLYDLCFKNNETGN